MKYYQTSYKLRAAQKINTSSTAATLSTAINNFIETVRIASNVDVWFNQGSSTVTASSTNDGSSVFLPGGTVEYINPYIATYFSVLANSSSGFFTITECSQ